MDQVRILLCGNVAGERTAVDSAFTEAESVARFHFPEAQIFNPLRTWWTGTAHRLASIEYLAAHASLVLMLPGWEGSQHCKLIRDAAQEWDIDIAYLKWAEPHPIGRMVLG